MCLAGANYAWPVANDTGRVFKMSDETLQYGGRSFRHLDQDELDRIEAEHGDQVDREFDEWLRSGGADEVLSLATADGRMSYGWSDMTKKRVYAALVVGHSSTRSE